MDPRANLDEQLHLATEILDRAADRRHLNELEQDAVRLAELVHTLDAWRQKGGFDPYAKEAR